MKKYRGESSMNIIHVMKDGTVRDSVEGVVITCDEFYQVLQRIIEKKKVDE